MVLEGFGLVWIWGWWFVVLVLCSRVGIILVWLGEWVVGTVYLVFGVLFWLGFVGGLVWWGLVVMDCLF